MRNGRCTEEQMVTILREVDHRSVPEVARKHGVSEQTIDAWRKRFGTLAAMDVRRLRHLEHEHSRLKKLGGRARSRDRGPQGDHAKNMVRARARRQQVAYARSRGVSSRRACARLPVARSTSADSCSHSQFSSVAGA